MPAPAMIVNGAPWAIGVGQIAGVRQADVDGVAAGRRRGDHAPPDVNNCMSTVSPASGEEPHVGGVKALGERVGAADADAHGNGVRSARPLRIECSGRRLTNRGAVSALRRSDRTHPRRDTGSRRGFPRTPRSTSSPIGQKRASWRVNIASQRIDARIIGRVDRAHVLEAATPSRFRRVARGRRLHGILTRLQRVSARGAACCGTRSRRDRSCRAIRCCGRRSVPGSPTP